jgi:hypothetical protein
VDNSQAVEGALGDPIVSEERGGASRCCHEHVSLPSHAVGRMDHDAGKEGDGLKWIGREIYGRASGQVASNHVPEQGPARGGRLSLDGDFQDVVGPVVD